MQIRMAMYEALKAIDVPEPKIEAVIQALECALRAPPAIKSDPEIAHLRAVLHKLEIDLTINIGLIIFTASSLLYAGIAFIH